MNPIVHFLGYGMTACQMQGPPKDWPEGHRWTSNWDEVTCPECLKGKEPIDTFTISADGKSITCKRCGRTSHNLNDVEWRYCGFCHVFHEDIWPPARRWWIEHPPEDMVVVVCDCGFRLGIKKFDLDEITAGVWGTIPCPRCKARLNDKIKVLV